eukprot:scaffold110954_cov27-Prasinocladus_malaysianus.AAC.1
MLQGLNLLLRRFVGNRLLSDGQYIHFPRLWMLFCLVVSFTQVLEGIAVGVLRICWLVMMGLFSILRLDKAVLPALKHTDVGYNSFMGHSLYELAVSSYSGMQMGASIRQLFASAELSSFRHTASASLGAANGANALRMPEASSGRSEVELKHSHAEIGEDLSTLKGTPFEALAR